MLITPALAGPPLDEIRALFREYEAFLGFSLCFQSFEEEIAGLPGKYAPPSGRLLLASPDHGPAGGCVALRDLGAGTCEMKRLFVRPAQRGQGLGRRLAAAILAEGRAAGYRRMVLDTVPKLAEAIGLYRSLGFREISAYCHNPIEGALFFERTLAPPV